MQGIEARVTGEGIGIGGTPRGDGAPGVRLEVGGELDGLRDLVQRLLVRNGQLEQALETRIVIEQAKGVLAERLGLDPEAAFEVLRRAARNGRMRIHDLAGRVVQERETPAEIAEALG